MARKANTKPPAEVPGAAIDLSYWDTRINSLQTRLGRDPSDAALWADLGIVRGNSISLSLWVFCFMLLFLLLVYCAVVRHLL